MIYSSKNGQQDLTIQKGSTFRMPFLWASETKSYAAITGITAAAPAVVTATAHGIPDGWPVKIKDVEGMTQINSDTLRKAVYVTDNSVRFPEINASGYDAYTSGGVLEFNTPVDLTSFTARCQIRSSVSSDTVLVSLTTENGGIEIDTTDYTITLVIDADDSEDFTWRRGVYSIELIAPDGSVSQIVQGAVFAESEVTR
jgi:hypothetical protein